MVKRGESPRIRFPAADRYPAWLWWGSLLVASPVLGFFLYRGEHLRALIATLSIGAFLFTAVPLRGYKDRYTYWAVLALFAVFHVIFVLSIKVEHRNFPGTIFTPFAVVDVLMWQAIFVALGRLVQRFD